MIKVGAGKSTSTDRGLLKYIKVYNEGHCSLIRECLTSKIQITSASDKICSWQWLHCGV